MEENLRKKIKHSFPPHIWQKLSDIRYTLHRASQIPLATFHPLRRQSIKRIKQYHNKYKGERCFIIGNGPSLQKTNLQMIKGEISFGLNRIYLLFEQLGFSTTFLVVVNDLVIEQFAPAMLELPIPKFFSWHSRGLFKIPPNIAVEQLPMFLHTTYTAPTFAKDACGRLWEGATVTYVALQLAFYMGFNQVILVGVDHSFSTKGKANTTIVSQGDDANHFSSHYFGKGVRWQLPDLETSEKAYRMARDVFENDGRVVVDATIEGKLQVFPKIPFDDLFK